MKYPLLSTVLSLALLGLGCRRYAIHFPEKPLARQAASKAGADVAWDTDGDGLADYFYDYRPEDTSSCPSRPRTWRIGYDRNDDALPDEWIQLDDLDRSGALHLVIILDGISHEVAREYYQGGGLSLLGAPSRVIAPYPTMTDMCIQDLLNGIPVPGFEAEYYDPEDNTVVGGKWAYITGANQPYNDILDYRANLIWDAVGYVLPGWVFRRELDHAKRDLEIHRSPNYLAYFVSSAGVGTSEGARGQLKVLADVERLVNQVVWERRGLVHVTVLSDHGHSYTPSVRAPLEEHLRRAGWDLTNRLRDEKDAVVIRFGLVTYASISTRDPARLAQDLVDAEGVDLISYRIQQRSKDGGPQPMRLVVLSADGGKAFIDKDPLRPDSPITYTPARADPLKLKNVLQAGRNGAYHADSPWVTARHEYPLALRRLWRAHFGLVENPPDVIVSLKDGYYFGSEGFAGFVDVASTHGSLNRSNSTAFIMSTLDLPPVMESRTVPGILQEASGRDFPPRR
jgi:hypothetical protein